MNRLLVRISGVRTHHERTAIDRNPLETERISLANPIIAGLAIKAASTNTSTTIITTFLARAVRTANLLAGSVLVAEIWVWITFTVNAITATESAERIRTAFADSAFHWIAGTSKTTFACPAVTIRTAFTDFSALTCQWVALMSLFSTFVRAFSATAVIPTAFSKTIRLAPAVGAAGYGAENSRYDPDDDLEPHPKGPPSDVNAFHNYAIPHHP
jgi:hypothetical protein